MDYAGTWGFYRGFVGISDEMVDSDCLEEFNSIHPHGKVFHCLEEEENMLTIEYGKSNFKIDAQLYREVEEPTYKVGDLVEITEKSAVGRVADIFWHIKNDAPYYILEIQGRKSGRRYWDAELKKVVID